MTPAALIIGYVICGWAAAAIVVAKQEKKRQRGDPATPWAYFALGYVGLLLAALPG